MVAKTTDIDGYLSNLPEAHRTTLEGLRATIKALVPSAVESISYGIPTFTYQGRRLIYFGAAKNHCAIYGTSAGTLRFPPGEPPSEGFVKTLLDERIATIEAEAVKRPRGKRNPGPPG